MSMSPSRKRRTRTVEVSAAERAYAAQLTAADLAAFNAELAMLDQFERAALAALAGPDDPDAEEVVADLADEDRYRLAQATWLEQLCTTSTDLDPHSLLPVIAADPATIDTAGTPYQRLAQLALIRRLSGWLAARELDIVAALCPPPDRESSDGFLADKHLAEEISVVCTIGTYAAEGLLEDARAAATVFSATRDRLAHGDISRAHLGVLVAETAVLEDDPQLGDRPETGQAVPWRSAQDKQQEIQARVLPRAGEQTVAQFRRAVRTAICAVDPHGSAERRRQALERRDVTTRTRAGEPMGELSAHDDASTIAAVHAELTRQARDLQHARGGARAARTDPGARLGACRADVLAAAILGTPPLRTGNETQEISDTAPTSDTGETDAADACTCTCGHSRRRVLEGHLVIDLATLRREADNPCLLDGEPIPAPVGRELARAVQVWRRIVTDPVTGHLLDYGRRTYLPEPLIRFIRARDKRCTAPYCERPARQVDHRLPYPLGPSNTANEGGLCELHHALKTAGFVDINDGHADGSMTWHTLWGQHVTVRPQAYLPNPGAPPGPDSGPPRAPEPQMIEDEPPF